jgi:hypothetical protein
MSDIGKPERTTQNRVIALFRHALGYRFLGNWTDREINSNIEGWLITGKIWLGEASRRIIAIYIDLYGRTRITAYN